MPRKKGNAQDSKVERSLPWNQLAQTPETKQSQNGIPWYLQRGRRACSITCPGIDPETQARCRISGTNRPIDRGEPCVLPRGRFSRWWRENNGKER